MTTKKENVVRQITRKKAERVILYKASAEATRKISA